MRHIYVYRAAYIVAALLVLVSIFFAWIRSQQLVIATEHDVEMSRFIDITDITTFDWEDYGRETYVANCLNCHGAEGQGRGAYPPLIGQGAFFAASEGRTYLIDVILYGLASERTGAPMPWFNNLSDVQVAAVNNYLLTRWGNEAQLPEDAELYLPSDVAAERGKGLSPWDVNERRSALE